LETRFRRLWLVSTMGIYVGGVLVERIRFARERASVLERVAHAVAAPARPPDGAGADVDPAALTDSRVWSRPGGDSIPAG